MSQVRRSLLDQELMALNEKIAQMGRLVDAAVEKAMTAVCERDAELGQAVIAGDAAVNNLRFQIEQGAMQAIARHQPVAGDLRALLVITHSAVELERIGDHAADIGYLAQHLAAEPTLDDLHKLPMMAESARHMVRDAVQAFLQRDETLARAILQQDDQIDVRFRRLVAQTLEEMQTHDNVRRAHYLLWIGHELERVGDRATNLAERVLFLLNGEYLEETSEFDWLD